MGDVGSDLLESIQRQDPRVVCGPPARLHRTHDQWRHPKGVSDMVPLSDGSGKAGLNGSPWHRPACLQSSTFRCALCISVPERGSQDRLSRGKVLTQTCLKEQKSWHRVPCGLRWHLLSCEMWEHCDAKRAEGGESRPHHSRESSAELGCGLLWPHPESGSPLVFLGARYVHSGCALDSWPQLPLPQVLCSLEAVTAMPGVREALVSWAWEYGSLKRAARAAAVQSWKPTWPIFPPGFECALETEDLLTAPLLYAEHCLEPEQKVFHLSCSRDTMAAVSPDRNLVTLTSGLKSTHLLLKFKLGIIYYNRKTDSSLHIYTTVVLSGDFYCLLPWFRR